MAETVDSRVESPISPRIDKAVSDLRHVLLVDAVKSAEVEPDRRNIFLRRDPAKRKETDGGQAEDRSSEQIGRLPTMCRLNPKAGNVHRKL